MPTAGASVPFLVLHALHRADLFHFGLFIARDAKTCSIFGFTHNTITPFSSFAGKHNKSSEIRANSQGYSVTWLQLPASFATLIMEWYRCGFFAGDKSFPLTVYLFVLEYPK